MNAVPLELPVKASEAAALADLIFQHTGNKPLNEDVRARLAGRVSALGLSSIRPCIGSLQRDPVQAGTFYIAADGLSSGTIQPLLLHMSQVSAPATALFPHALLIGRMRPGGGREVVVSAIPFTPSNVDQIRTFVEQVDPEFQPRPQGTQFTIEVGSSRPDVTLPAAFEAFRAIQKSANANVACISTRDLEAGLWAAIRTGWRAGYAAAMEPIVLDPEAPEVSNESFAGFTRFSVNPSRLFRAPGAEEETRYLAEFKPEEREWIEEEFSRKFQVGESVVEFADEDVRAYTLRFGAGLRAAEAVFDQIAKAKGSRKAFDFELVIDSGAPTTPLELLFCLQWMRSRGRSPQLVAPNLGKADISGCLEALVPVVRRFNAAISIEARPDLQPELVQHIARITGNRLNWRMPRDFDKQMTEHSIRDCIIQTAANLRG